MLTWIACIVVTALFLILVLLTSLFWKPPAGGSYPKVTVERAEKSADAVLSVCALLIPATLGLLTWLQEKIGPGTHLIPLAFALGYFFVLLIFTVHLRFNFLWQHKTDFEVSPTAGMRFAYWLTTATSSIVLGLVLLSLPVLGLSLGWLKIKEPAPGNAATKIECNCPPAPAPPTAVTANPQQKSKTSTQHHKSRKTH